MQVSSQEPPDITGVLKVERQDLLKLIQALELQLAASECVPSQPVEPTLDPERDVTEDGVDRGAWNRGDIGLLEGCWELDGEDYRVRNASTGSITTYTQWEMCFDAAGNGRQSLSSPSGVTCEESVEARFSGEGELQLSDPRRVQCSNDTYIFRRDSRCTLGDDDVATCTVEQPDDEEGGSATVRLRRKEG